MQLLTSTGYKPIEEVTESDLLVAYDMYSGEIIYNHLIEKERWTYDMFPPVYNGAGELVYTPEEYYVYQFGSWTFYQINDNWKLYKQQSIWVNTDKVVAAENLQVGDEIYDDQNQPIIITKIEEVQNSEWWRLTISGDHSFIADNLTQHNASRYWVGGGSTANWNATGPTNWSSSGGGVNNASVPTSVDDAIFDGQGASGNTNNTLNTGDVLTWTILSGYTGTTSHTGSMRVRSNVSIYDGYAPSRQSGIQSFRGGTNATSYTWALGGFIFLDYTPDGGTCTLSGTNLNVRNVFNSLSQTFNSNTTEIIIVRGNYSTGGFQLLGTADIYLTGSTASFDSPLGTGNNFYLSGGAMTMGTGNFQKNGNTLKIFTGSLTQTASSILVIGGTTILDLSGSTIRNLQINNNQVVRLDSDLNVSGTTTCPGNATFSGSAILTTSGFSVTNTTAAATVTIPTGTTYVITGSMFANTATLAVQPTFASSSATFRANLTLQQGATCNVRGNFTRINAISGRTINSFNGTITDCVNVRTYDDLPNYTSTS